MQQSTLTATEIWDLHDEVQRFPLCDMRECSSFHQIPLVSVPGIFQYFLCYEAATADAADPNASWSVAASSERLVLAAPVR